MNRRLARLLLMLYPRPWRERYGTEVVRLTQDLIVTGETTPARGALNTLAAPGHGRKVLMLPSP